MGRECENVAKRHLFLHSYSVIHFMFDKSLLVIPHQKAQHKKYKKFQKIKIKMKARKYKNNETKTEKPAKNAEIRPKLTSA